MERLRAQVGSTLDQLTPNELKEFKFYLRHCEEPRITAQDLDLAGTTPELADLLQKRYVRSETPRVLAQVLKRVRRMDLAAEWDSIERASRMNLKRPYEDDGPELERYNMDQKRKAFVMCVKTGRPGAEQDMNRIKKWLDACKFDYESCIDPDEEELFEKLRQFRDEINGIPDDISCCLVTLMAHGEEGVIKTKLEERVNLSDIFEMFSNEKCPVLQEKPKIFVIQACRGDKRDGGVVQADDEPMELDSEKKRLPTFSDYFIIYPTQKDHVALRHPKYGSVMIQAIDEVFQQHGMKLHIADFFTQVNNRVVHTDYYMSKNPVKVVLVMESTLTKAVYF
ncbi:caspase-14-like isoform X1 [Dromiciops gliroides]|uniref:caspase-14-like isoform X1 n=1 Tax=Dromiciops gliroides TaxID=33562 RepID=UPI001CC5986E|nr:caspase-14-like isoform X1 [Dromiciops gliroides]XP_043823204.1 caspase-14-like isoform X1 [Dromiciops gliroides]